MTKNGEVVIKTWVLKVYIHCEGCKKKVKKVLQSIEGVLTTTIDAPEQKVTVTGSVASADILVKKLLKAGKHAKEWPQPQKDKEKDKVKEKDKDPQQPKQKEKEKEKKEKEKKAAKDEDSEEGAKKSGGKKGEGSGEGAKKVEDAEESGGASPSEGNKGGGSGAESSGSGGGKKKKGGKGGGGQAMPVEPRSFEGAEFSGFSPVASGGGYGHMSGGGYGHMSGGGEEWMRMGGASNRPIVQYVQYAPPNAMHYTQQSAATVESATYAFNDENTGSCSVM